MISIDAAQQPLPAADGGEYHRQHTTSRPSTVCPIPGVGCGLDGQTAAPTGAEVVSSPQEARDWDDFPRRLATNLELLDDLDVN
jgi:hypothetical protein